MLGKMMRLAVLAGTILRDKGYDVKVKDVRDSTIDELKNFDLIILGAVLGMMECYNSIFVNLIIN